MVGSGDQGQEEGKEGGGLVSAMTDIPQAVSRATGLAPADAELVRELLDVWRRKRPRNLLRSRYYGMHQRPRELGISVPPHLRTLEQVVGWPAKAVDALVARSQFDGYVSDDTGTESELRRIVASNGLRRAYRKAATSECKHSCAFATVTAGADGPEVRFHPATSSAALWDFGRNRIRAGLVVVDYERGRGRSHLPTWVDVFTDSAVIVIMRGRAGWHAEYLPHSMGRCLMEPLAYAATLERPFGKSRITRAVMNITDDAMRESVRSEISAEFFTSPQKYLLGADKEALGDQTKWDAYIGNIFSVSRDEDNNVPTFGQLSQGSMQPHVDYMRQLAARFSGETNVPVSSLGVVSDNPSSAEAIYAAKEDMVIDAQNLNADNGEALRNVAYMALAVARGTDYATEVARAEVRAKFANPATPSAVSRADALLKIVQASQVDSYITLSDVFLEEAGFDDDQIQRLQSARARSQSQAILAQARQAAGLPPGPAGGGEPA